MKLKAFLILSFMTATVSYAQVTVRCEGSYQNDPEIISVKIDEKGEIVEWEKNKMAKAEDQGSNFVGGLANDIEEYGYEGISSFRGNGGVAVLRMITTADVFKLAISADRSKATFVYEDIGSGAGDHTFDLKCAILR